MSLFKCREVWSTNLDTPDAFDSNSILVDYINGLPCVWVGSHDGYLRAYQPQAVQELENDETSEAKTKKRPKMEDLLYEALYDVPVLQLAKGSFVSGSAGRELVVLHSRSFCVYEVTKSPDVAPPPDDTDPLSSAVSLRLLYQHQLTRPAYNLVSGPFGRVPDRDFICVQSLDGLLSFFEHETVGGTIQLGEILLASPLLYLPRTDSFVYQDANHNVLCFNYEQLMTARKPAWVHNLGETSIQMQAVQMLDEFRSAYIIVLTERNVFNLSSEGAIVWNKRLETPPMCIRAYISPQNNTLMSLVCLESRRIDVYEGTHLRWAAQLDLLPVSVSIVDGVAGTDGLLLLLTDTGLIECVYLGTQPSLYLLPSAPEPELDLATAEAELNQLQKVITADVRDHEQSGDVLTASIAVGDVIIGGQIPMCLITIALKALTPLNNVQVVLQVEPPLMVVSDLGTKTTISKIVSSVVNIESVTWHVCVNTSVSVSSLNAHVTVIYLGTEGGPRVLELTAMLPWGVALVNCPPAKDAPVKLTLNTTNPPIPPGRLFNADESSQAVAVTSPMELRPVTILAGRTSRRYRIQAETHENLSLVVSLIIQKQPGISFTGPLPVAEYLTLVQALYDVTRRRREVAQNLGSLTAQYRAVQKKVLASVKELQAPPAKALYRVLDDTYAIMCSDVLKMAQLTSQWQDVAYRLTAVSRLMTSLLGVMAVSKSDLAVLSYVLNDVILDGDEQGWLETQYALLSMLLRTSLAKSSRDQAKTTPLSLDAIDDVTKVTKLITTALDRVTKGASLVERQEYQPISDVQATMASVKEWTDEASDSLKGSKLTDLQGKSTRPSKSPPVPEKITQENRPSTSKGHLLDTAESLSSEIKHLDIAKVPIASAAVPVKTQEEDDGIWDINIDDVIL